MKNKIASVILCILMLFTSFQVFAQKTVMIPEEENAQEQGIILVLVVDISQSIKEQLDAIMEGLSDEIVDKRLQGGDYCVVVPLGDASNVDRAKSFPIILPSDKNAIKDYLVDIKARMPTNLNTDIGAAMEKTFENISRIDSENDGKMMAPQVLFITDGEIFGSKNSPDKLRYNTTDEIFQKKEMDPVYADYENWYFLGIENEGVPLEHIKNIAERVGAYPDRYVTLDNMDRFGELFDSWLRSIPDPDNGFISFSPLQLSGKELSSSPEKYSTVPTSTDVFNWTMKSTYKRTDIVMTFTSITGIFQNDSTGEVTKFQITPEAGNLEFAPGTSRETRAHVSFPKLHGKGTLKLDIQTQLNKTCEVQIPEYSFYVNFKSPLEILLWKILPPIIAVILIVIIVIVARIINERKPVKVQFDVGTGSSRKSGKVKRVVSMKIGKSVQFGSKAGLQFRIESDDAPRIAGELVRTGPSTWVIEPKDGQFPDEAKLNPYKLGTSVKMTLADGSTTSIKFSKERK